MLTGQPVLIAASLSLRDNDGTEATEFLNTEGGKERSPEKGKRGGGVEPGWTADIQALRVAGLRC